ncbi:hypothetical protein BASA81_015584 [Batrachochytrium salamandrivorans]|nr:hypothetical protein BASA81_015584 [Batrachochytrium salamandrivorans]
MLSEFLTSVLAALQRAIDDKNAPTAVRHVLLDAQQQASIGQGDCPVGHRSPMRSRLYSSFGSPWTRSDSSVFHCCHPKQPAPQGEKEIRQWLSKHKRSEEIADKLVKEDLVEAEDLSNLNQALTLGAALKEFF